MAIPGVLIFCFTAILSMLLTRQLSGEELKNKLGEAVRQLSARRVNLPKLREIEMNLIIRSNIRRYVGFMNIYILFAICGLIFFALFAPVNTILTSAPASAIICAILACVPAFILDIMRKVNAEAVRAKLAEFISVLCRWCAVKEDIFFAFEKSLESGIGEPMNTYVRDMLIQARSGLDPADALEIIRLKVDNAQFGDFIINIKQNIKCKGEILKLMTAMEDQFYRLKAEFERRRISTLKDRILIYVIMGLVLIIGWYLLQTNVSVRHFYLDTAAGKTMVTIITAMYAMGVGLVLKLTDFEY